MKHIIYITLAIVLVLFVFVPAAFIFLGKIGNPLSLTAMSGLTPQYKTGSSSISSASKPAVNCSSTTESYEPHKRDAKIKRDGDKSIISSDAYGYSLTLPEAIYDWDYTKGSLKAESASFVYKETIINVLAETTSFDCNAISAKIYNNFNNSNQAVEYFSSRTYRDQGQVIGLQKAIYQTQGTSKINSREYHWYRLDEQYQNSPDHIVSTKWYSTRIGRTEYWFAFRAFKDTGDQTSDIAEEVLGTIEYDSVL